jgi:hypothetical protein
MGKVIKESKKSESRSFFASGGNEKMYGKGRTGGVQPGISGKESNSPSEHNAGPSNQKGQKPEYAHDYKFLEGGGSNKMFGKGHAGKATPGVSGKASQEG